MKLTRPSSLPAHAVSPRWESAGSSNAAMAGQDRHLALEELIQNKARRPMFDLLDKKDQDSVMWAADHVLDVAKLEDKPILSEHHLSIMRDGVEVLDGTADAIVGNHLFDLKTSERNYHEQMCAYSLGVMQKFGFDEVVVHLMFCETKHLVRYRVTQKQCEDIVFGILDRVSNPSTTCAASDYCKWCKKQATCEIVLGHVSKVANHYEMIPLEQMDLVSTEQIARALNLAVVAEEWASSIKEKAKELALNHVRIPGWEIKERSATREIDPKNINNAFDRLHIPQEDFLAACKVSVSKLANALIKTGMSKREADQVINDRLLGLIEQKPAVKYLSRIKA